MVSLVYCAEGHPERLLIKPRAGENQRRDRAELGKNQGRAEPGQDRAEPGQDGEEPGQDRAEPGQDGAEPGQ